MVGMREQPGLPGRTVEGISRTFLVDHFIICCSNYLSVGDLWPQPCIIINTQTRTNPCCCEASFLEIIALTLSLQSGEADFLEFETARLVMWLLEGKQHQNLIYLSKDSNLLYESKNGWQLIRVLSPSFDFDKLSKNPVSVFWPNIERLDLSYEHTVKQSIV